MRQPLFSKEPLKEFLAQLKKTKSKSVKSKGNNNEDILFVAIISIFFLGIVISFQTTDYGLTGRAIYEEKANTIELSKLYNQSDYLSLTLDGNITSLRITGKFFGNGTGKIYLGERLIIDTDNLNQVNNNLLTGLVIEEIESQQNDPQLSDVNDSLINEELTTPEIKDNVTNESLVQPINLSEGDLIETQLILADTNITTELNTSQNTSFEEEILVGDVLGNESINNSINESIDINLNETNETLYEQVSETIATKSFDNYCIETCNINLPRGITLFIQLEDMILNLSSITYTYLSEFEETIEEEPIEEPVEEPVEEPIEGPIEEPIIVPPFEEAIENISNETITINITENITENLTQNLTQNITELNLTLTNETINESIDLILNLTLNESLNLTLNESINETLNATNITEIIILQNLSDIEQYNLSLLDKGLNLFRYDELKNEFLIGKDEFNFVKFTTEDINKINVDIIENIDTRLTSKIIYLEGENTSFSVTLEVNEANVLLKCLQFQNEICKKWVKTNISFALDNNTIKTELNEQGVYATANIQQNEIEFVQTNSIYFNTDYELYQPNCNAESFCTMQNALSRRVNFFAQMDFDILELEETIERAEVCSYLYYYNEPVFNYLKSSSESFCSNLKFENISSSLISYKIIDPEKGWKCIDATEIIKDAQEKGYSNIFINWLGQDLSGENFPFTCYYGNSPISNCDYYNPSGAADCRPYLRLVYK